MQTRTLDILIPQYDEDESVIKPLLDSIAIQQNVNFKRIGVIIVNDGSDVILSNEFLDSYPFDIEYYRNKHMGVSATRNACLDHSSADYVMFCDADDMFYMVCGLWIIFQEIDGNGGFDSLTTAFVEETRVPNYPKRVMYVPHELDSTFVHGKIHKRQYLIDQNIRWNDNLTIHEDSYFNILCQKLSKEVKYCPTPFYLWRWRENSVCRHDPKYILKTFKNMLWSNNALVNEFIRREKMDEAKFYATMLIYDCYFMMNKEEWIDQENQQYRIETELEFSKNYYEFKELFDTIDPDVRHQIIMGTKNNKFREGMFLEKITFDDWIKHIEETYPKE